MSPLSVSLTRGVRAAALLALAWAVASPANAQQLKAIHFARNRADAWGAPLYVQPVDGGLAKPLGMGIARAR